MSNYTDNFNGTNMDQRPEEQFPAEVKSIENVQMAYRECVEAIIHIMKRRGLTHYQRNVKGFGECIDRLSFTGLSDFLEAGCDDFSTLAEAGYDYSAEGDDHVAFFDRMHALLKQGEIKQPATMSDLMDIIGAFQVQGVTAALINPESVKQ